MKIGEHVMNWIKNIYTKRNVTWDKSDDFVWGFGIHVLPIIIWIPLMFWLLKYAFIDYMYVKYGFEKTIIFIAIIMFVRPMIMDLFTKLLKIKEESK